MSYNFRDIKFSTDYYVHNYLPKKSYMYVNMTVEVEAEYKGAVFHAYLANGWDKNDLNKFDLSDDDDILWDNIYNDRVDDIDINEVLFKRGDLSDEEALMFIYDTLQYAKDISGFDDDVSTLTDYKESEELDDYLYDVMTTDGDYLTNIEYHYVGNSEIINVYEMG